MSIDGFRKVALAEATSFIALLIASVLKRTSDLDVLVHVLGPIHGVLFVAYVVIALGIRKKAGWTLGETLAILLGAVLPFGGYVVDRWLSKREAPRV